MSFSRPAGRVALLMALGAIAVTLWTRLLLQERHFLAAPLAALLDAVQQDPEDDSIRRALAWRLEQLGQNDHAAAAYAQIVRRADDARAWSGLGRTLASQGKTAPSLAVLRAYAARHPRDAFPRADTETPTALPLLLADADALRRGRNKEDALRAYEALLRRAPQNAAAWAGAGATLDALNRPAEAFAAYDKAVTFDPARADWQYLLAERAYQAGLLRDAARRFRQVTKTNPTNHRAWYQLGVILASARAFPTEARDAFAAAVRLSPGNALYHAELAEAQATAGGEKELDAAVREFRAARRLAPGDPMIAGRMGVFLAARNDAAKRAEARRLLEEAFAAAPEHELFRQELARLVLAGGDGARAIALLEPLTRRPKNPGQVNTFYVLSQAYKRQGDLPRAQSSLVRSRVVRAYYDRALTIQESAERHPRDASLRLSLARLHRDAGEDAKALDQYRAAERLTAEPRPVRREREIYEASLAAQNKLPDMTLFTAMAERSAP